MKINNKSDQPQYFFNSLIMIALTIMLAIVAIIYNNSERSSPVFLFLLTLGVGIASTMGLNRGGLLGLLLLSIWITTKQAIGVWSEDRLYLNLLEIIFATMAFVTNGFYHERLMGHFKEYQADQQKLKLLDLEDSTIGLIKSAIGLLRLKEEMDRALRYRRPLSLVLIIIHPYPGMTWKTRIKPTVMRAVATTIKDTTRNMDIPFLVDSEKIALLLPDTEINGVNKVLNNIVQKMNSTQVINPDGSSTFLQNYAQLRFGFGTFLGYSNKPFDLMDAAERSLQKSFETNPGNIFQNLFIDWEIIGDMAIANTVIAAAAKDAFEPLNQNADTDLISVAGNALSI
jgi:hypothetical protein